MSIALDRLRQDSIVAVIRRIAPDKFEPVITALLEGGIRSIEITMDAQDAAEQIQRLTQEYKDQLNIGAGTVIRLEDATVAVKAGARFLVCPHLDVHLLKHMNTLGVPIIPGIMTPTEIQTALNAGAPCVKIFPANVLGPGFIKDVLGPFSGLPIMVTGGLHADNFLEYLKVGASVVGMGSALFPAKDLENHDWDSITNRTISILNLIRKG